MEKAFPINAAETLKTGRALVAHLKTTSDTHGQKEWTSANLASLRSFKLDGMDLTHYPASPESNQKGAFLWDYVAYQQGDGILIVAESEHDNEDLRGLKHDFEKLFYAVAPIKLFMFTGDRDEYSSSEEIVKELRDYMSECCSLFMPGELYILYCRTWRNPSNESGDRAYFLQIPGEPNSVYGLTSEDKFQLG